MSTGSRAVQCNGTTPVIFQLPAPTNTVIVKQTGTGVARAWVTSDGSAPVVPSTSTVNSTSDVKEIPAVANAYVVLHPPLYGDHMVAPTLRFASDASPLLSVEW